MRFDDGKHNLRTLITFQLSGDIRDEYGIFTGASFPKDLSKAVKITENNGGANDQIQPKEGDTYLELVLDNKDNDQKPYNYCLSICVHDSDSPEVAIVPIDPSIVNR